MLKKAIPVLPAINISKTIDFYETKLGFEGTNYGNYAVLKYKNVEIHLFMNTAKTSNTNGGCLIQVDNIQDLYTRFCGKGIIYLKGKLTDKPWGIKEFTITDNNNNIIRFGEKR